MVTVEKAHAQKAASKKQIRTALPRVISHERHGARDECQNRGDSLKHGVKLCATAPRDVADRETAKKKNYGKGSIGKASPQDSIRLQESHLGRLSAGRPV